jgi:DNA polymerase-3 subunit gamma/tau
MEADVREMLGTIDDTIVARLLDALVAADAAAVLGVVADAAERGVDYDGLLQDLLLSLHRISLAQASPAVVEALGEDVERYTALAQKVVPEDVQLYYQIGLVGRRDLPLAPDPRSGFEMIMLRMLAFRPAASAGEETVQAPVAAPRAAVTAQAAVSAAVAKIPAPVAPAVAATVRQDASGWVAVIERIGLNGLARELANNTTLDSHAGDHIQLTLDATFSHLLSKEREEVLRKALDAYYGKAMTLRISVGSPQAETPAREKARQQDERQQAAVMAIAEDPNVRTLQETFNARVNPGSIRPKL